MARIRAASEKSVAVPLATEPRSTQHSLGFEEGRASPLPDSLVPVHAEDGGDEPFQQHQKPEH